MTYLPVWGLDVLTGMDCLDGALRRASQDDRLRSPAWLMVRCETTARRTVCVTTLGGQEASLPVRPAVRTPTIKHPLGHAPSDTIIGPVVGMVSYLPTEAGLRVLAFRQEGMPEHPPSPAMLAQGADIARAMRDDFTGKEHDDG